MASEKTFKLNNGVEMPALGFGCAFGNWTDPTKFFGFTPEAAWAPIAQALEAGYVHYDIALVYGTHRMLGAQLGNLHFSKGKKREEIFITTKLGHPQVPLALNRMGHSFDFADPKMEDDAYVRKSILNALEQSLEDLGVGYVDLLLMHWPGDAALKDKERATKLRKAIWATYEEIYKSKRARAIGVSNFNERHLNDILSSGTVKPACNQIEVSPYFNPASLIAFCKKNEILPVAWAPFGSGATGVLKDELVVSLAEKYKKNVGQVILRWLLQSGIAALPKSSSLSRAKSNLDIFDFQLTEEEVAQMGKLNKDKSSVGVDLDSIA